MRLAANSGCCNRLWRKPRLVGTPSILNSQKRAIGLRRWRRQSRRQENARSAWRAVSRSSGWWCSRRSRRCRCEAPGPEGCSKAVKVPPGGLGAAVGAHRFHVDAQSGWRSRAGSAVRSAGGRVPRANSRRQVELELDEIDAGNFLGDGVLDLQARIRLDEGEGRLAFLTARIDEELESAEIVVADLARQAHRGRGQAIAQRGRQARDSARPRSASGCGAG